jgi:hypothetical protein
MAQERCVQPIGYAVCAIGAGVAQPLKMNGAASDQHELKQRRMESFVHTGAAIAQVLTRDHQNPCFVTTSAGATSEGSGSYTGVFSKCSQIEDTANPKIDTCICLRIGSRENRGGNA